MLSSMSLQLLLLTREIGGEAAGTLSPPIAGLDSRVLSLHKRRSQYTLPLGTTFFSIDLVLTAYLQDAAFRMLRCPTAEIADPFYLGAPFQHIQKMKQISGHFP